MKKILIAISLIIASIIPVEAQVYYPDQVGAQPAFPISQSRKYVRTSTDVIALAMPVATLAGVLITQDWQGLKQGAFTALVAGGATEVLKYAIAEPRPDRSNNLSFPSGHSACTFATAAFLQRRYGWAFGAPAYALAAYVGWGRCFARRHNWWDVIAGAAIGAGSAYIFTTPFSRKHNLVLAPATDGRTFLLHASLTL